MTLSRPACAVALTLICAACDTHPNNMGSNSTDAPDRERSRARDRDDSKPRPSEGRSESEDTPDEAADDPDAPAVQVLGAATSADVLSPTDATPSPDGDRIYFLATSRSDDGRLASLHASKPDGSGVRTLAAGTPLAAPVGVAVSLDGETLFVADLDAGDGGAILQGSAESGDLAVIEGTEGLIPRAVSVASVDGREHVYFTGSAPGGEPAVYRLEPSGGEPTLLASGAPLSAPAGVIASSDGDVYVVDALADQGAAALLKVTEGAATILVGGLGVGFPAGLTLTLAEDTALVSGLSPSTGRDVVYVVDLETLALSRITDPVDAFAEPAGLHRAHNDDVFAWADSEANGSGTVFVLSL